MTVMIVNDPLRRIFREARRGFLKKGRDRFPKEKKRANESELKGSLEER